MNVSTKVITAKIMGNEGNRTKMTTCVVPKFVMKAIRNTRMNDEDRREKRVAMDASSSEELKKKPSCHCYQLEVPSLHLWGDEPELGRRPGLWTRLDFFCVLPLEYGSHCH